MRWIAAALLLLCTARLGGQAQSCPELGATASGVRLRLPTAMKAALHDFDPLFEPFTEDAYLKYLPRWSPATPKQALFAVIGDFNGDGICDVVVDGHGADTTRRIALLSSEGGVQVIPLNAEAYIPPEAVRYDNDRGYWVYLRVVAPSHFVSHYEEAPLHLLTDAFEIEYFEKASVLLYWQDGAFREYTTGD